jgi:uncharacterized protein
MDGLTFWLAAICAATLVGLSKGGLPLVGMLATPVLALAMPPVAAAGLLLPVFIATDVFGLYAYRKEFDKRLLMILVPATTIGVAIGGLTASFVPERFVTFLVGVIGVSFSLYFWLRKTPEPGQREPNRPLGLFWGAVAGFTSFVSHAGAPPYQTYVLPLGLPKAVFAGTTTILFAYVNAIKLIPYWWLGQLSPANLKLSAMVMAPGILAVFVGVKLVKLIPTELFYKLVVWALFFVSLRLLYAGAAG